MGGVKQILLTGGNGFLGSWILDLLIQEGYSPIVYLRPESDKWRIEHLEGKYIPFVSSGEKNAFNRLFNEYDFDAILHTATEYGRTLPLSKTIETNVLFPLTLIELGIQKSLKLFVNTDSFFGKRQYSQEYLGNYTASKRMLEGLLKTFASNLKIANLRIEHVFGKYDSENKFVTSILKQLIEGGKEILLTDGLQKRDFVYVEDVAEAYICVLKQLDSLSGYQEFEVGTGQATTVREFVSMMAELVNSDCHLKFGAMPVRVGEIMESFANNDTLKELGWQPRYNIENGIKRILSSEIKRFINGGQF